MTDTAQATRPLQESSRKPSPLRLAGVGLVAAALVLVLWGGYGHHWPWTGINGGTATLWDWLHLLLLPIAFGLLPVLLSRDTRLRSHHKAIVVAAITAFAIFVLAGYTIPWAWTGFQGNRLWDWLELLALPLAIAIAPVMRNRETSWERRHSVALAVGLIAFVAVVIGGYVGDWAWTGFRGNTLWDWMHLLLLPLLLPTIVVPALVPATQAQMAIPEESEPPPAEGP